MSRLSRLLSIWFRLVLISLDVLWYTARLHTQRFIHFLSEEISTWRNSNKSRRLTTKYTGKGEWIKPKRKVPPKPRSEKTHYPYCEPP